MRGCWRSSTPSKTRSDPPGFRFRCRRSGNCCSRPDGVVRVGAEDVAAIASHLQLSEAAFRSRFVAATGDRLVDGPGGRCPFLEDGRRTACSIYPVRPQKCRSWPHWDEICTSAAALRQAARLCPGIELGEDPLRGPLHEIAESADR